MASSTAVAPHLTGMHRPTTEDVLPAASPGDLDALLRDSPAGPLPTGVLDGTALLPGGAAAAALACAVLRQGKIVEPGGTSLRNRITPLGIRAVTARVRHYPDLAPALRNADNAFAPWPLPAGAGADRAQGR